MREIQRKEEVDCIGSFQEPDLGLEDPPERFVGTMSALAEPQYEPLEGSSCSYSWSSAAGWARATNACALFLPRKPELRPRSSE